MKTPLTFLLSLTFLFLFSGSVYGGVIDETIDNVFDRKGEVVLSCFLEDEDHYSYIVLNRKDKVIKYFIDNDGEEYKTFEIVKENEVFIMGKQKEEKLVGLLISKHLYEKHIHIKWGKNTCCLYGKEIYWSITNQKCSVGDKVF